MALVAIKTWGPQVMGERFSWRCHCFDVGASHILPETDPLKTQQGPLKTIAKQIAMKLSKELSWRCHLQVLLKRLPNKSP